MPATIIPFFLFSCSTATFQNPGVESPSNSPSGLFNIPLQIVNSQDVASIMLQKKGVEGSFPAIELLSAEQLELSFDLLEFDARTLYIEFTHHSKDWVPSPISPDVYIDGLQRVYLPFGSVSRGQRPLYRTYSYTFPDDQFQFTKSGNYTLRVTDSDTGYLLFSLPFFIHENEGSVTSSVESASASVRKYHRPVSRYSPPDFIEQPSFDLHFQFIQNRFLGRSMKNPQADFSNNREIYIEASNQALPIGDYEFMTLNLHPLSISNRQIAAFEPASTPMRATLTDDAAAFNPNSGRYTFSNFGSPSQNSSASYADVTFTLDADINPENNDIYLVGDFTNWAIQSDKKLEYNPEINRWQTTAFIKEGRYAYKYILMNNNQIDDLYFDARFSRNKQEYLMLVYMSDNREFYDRLLQYGQFYSDN